MNENNEIAPLIWRIMERYEKLGYQISFTTAAWLALKEQELEEKK